MTPEIMLRVMGSLGASQIMAKPLAPNDNSKNQIYLGGDFGVLQKIPFGALREDTGVAAGSKRARLKAEVGLLWLAADGSLEPASGTNLILYPKYPEVRMSGMLTGLTNRQPASVIASRSSGRWLFLAATNSGQVIAHSCHGNEPCARWAEDNIRTHHAVQDGVFWILPLQSFTRDDIFTALRKVAGKGWIDSKRLDGSGNTLPCNSPNCGGYTLEAELGVRPNGRADPDYDGWEVKQFGVTNLTEPNGGRVTLMTPEPNGGYYVDEGAEAFIRRYGYADRTGVPDRLNFGGVHIAGKRHKTTGLTMTLTGWESDKERISDLRGGIELLDRDGFVAARWSFESMLNHWKRKHARAVYVPSNCEAHPRRYRFGSRVLIGKGTDFPILLRAFQSGAAFYDPGIKLEKAASLRPELKRRSQFRILVKNLNALYDESKWIDVTTMPNA